MNTLPLEAYFEVFGARFKRAYDVCGLYADTVRRCRGTTEAPYITWLHVLDEELQAAENGV